MGQGPVTSVSDATTPSEIFKISVVETADGLFVRAIKGVEGRFDAEAVKSIHENLKDLRRRGADGLLDLNAQEMVAKTIGHALFKALFAGDVLAEFDAYRRRSYPPRIGLSMPRDYYWVPWELLRDPDEKQFFSLFGSVIRYDPAASAAVAPGPAARQKRFFNPLEADAKLQCLLLLPNPEDRAVPSFRPHRIASIEYIAVQPPTLKQFLTTLDKRQSRGLIFYGHGDVQVDAAGVPHDISVLVFVKEDDEEEGLPSLVTDPVAATVIAGEIFKSNGHPYLQFACVLACESADAKDEESFSRSLAGALLEGTYLDFVIGAQLKIQHFAARAFLAGILGALKAGRPLDLAITDARMAVRRVSPFTLGRKRSALDWWIPVLYARDDAQLQILSTRKDEFSTTPRVRGESLGSIKPVDLVALGRHVYRAFVKGPAREGVAGVLGGPGDVA